MGLLGEGIRQGNSESRVGLGYGNTDASIRCFQKQPRVNPMLQLQSREVQAFNLAFKMCFADILKRGEWASRLSGKYLDNTAKYNVNSPFFFSYYSSSSFPFMRYHD